MAKAPSTKSIEKALGIADGVNKLNVETSDDDKRKMYEERQKKLQAIKDQFEKKRATYEQDKDFIKDLYREVAETSMMAVRIMQEEAGMTGDYKNVEALAAAANAVTQALDGLKNVELDEEKLRIERDKVGISKMKAESIVNKPSILGEGVGKTVNNIVHVGSTGDLVRALKQLEREEKTIEATAEVVVEKKDE